MALGELACHRQHRKRNRPQALALEPREDLTAQAA